MLNKKTNSTINKNKLNEKFPNENLFKSDKKYHINKDLQFDSPIENQNCSFDIFKRKLPLIKFSIVVMILNYSIYFSIKNFSLFFLSLIQILIFPILLYIVKNLEAIENPSFYTEFEKNLQHIRIVFELLSTLNVYMEFVHKIEMNESTALTQDCAFLNFIQSNFFNFLTNRNSSQAILWLMLKGIALLTFTSRSELSLLSRGFTNLFSSDCMILLFYIVCSILVEWLKKRNLVELWGLYDSFKRSFHIFKRCLYDDFPYPIFIISRKQYDQILYKNKAADKLHEKICASKTQLKNGTGNTNIISGSNNNNQNPSVNNNESTSNTAAIGLNKRTFRSLNSGNAGGLSKKSALATRKINYK